MSLSDPQTARPRTDLPFLRRRSQPSTPAAGVPGRLSAQEALALFIAGKLTRRLGLVPGPTTPGPTTPGPEIPAPAVRAARRIDMTRPSRGRATPAPSPTPTSTPAQKPATGAQPGIDMSRPPRSRPQPAASSGLDLGLTPPAPAAPQSSGNSLDLDLSPSATPPRTPAPAVSSSLDLSPRPTAPAQPASSGSSSLDLDLDLSSGPSPTRRRSAAPVAAGPGPPPVRAESGRRVILTYAEPTVTLTRIQSGIGSLEMEGAWTRQEDSPVGLGCAYVLRSGESSTVQLAGGRDTAPPRSRRPVLIARGGEFEGFGLDLRQCGELERLIVYAFSESGAPVDWTGTFITRTYGSARIEMPLAQLRPSSLAVLASIYNIGGQLVLRAELEPMSGPVRDACESFGFDKITWLDERTSID